MNSGANTGQTSNSADVSNGNDAVVVAYVSSVMNADANVSKVSSTDSKVTVTYKAPGRFLGIFPMSVPVSATANADGTAKISYPWYDSLNNFDSASASANLSAQVSTVVGSSSTNTNGQLSDSIKTSLIAKLHTFFQNWVEGSAAASASASGTASY